MNAWQLFWNAPNYYDENGVPREVYEHVEGNIFSGYEWVPNEELDLSKYHGPWGTPLL